MKMICLCFWVTVFLLVSVGNAHAYLDPGTGSAILQGILGALAAIAVALKLYWHRFLRLIGLRKKVEEAGDSQDEEVGGSQDVDQTSDDRRQE